MDISNKKTHYCGIEVDMAEVSNFYCSAAAQIYFISFLQKMICRELFSAAMDCKRAKLEYEEYKIAVIRKEIVYDKHNHENLKELIAISNRVFWHRVNTVKCSNIASECSKLIRDI